MNITENSIREKLEKLELIFEEVKGREDFGLIGYLKFTNKHNHGGGETKSTAEIYQNSFYGCKSFSFTKEKVDLIFDIQEHFRDSKKNDKGEYIIYKNDFKKSNLENRKFTLKEIIYTWLCSAEYNIHNEVGIGENPSPNLIDLLDKFENNVNISNYIYKNSILLYKLLAKFENINFTIKEIISTWICSSEHNIHIEVGNGENPSPNLQEFLENIEDNVKKYYSDWNF